METNTQERKLSLLEKMFGKKKTISFSALDTSFKTRQDFIFNDDGFVSSLAEHHKKISLENGLNGKNYGEEFFNNLAGCCSNYYHGETLIQHIYYLDLGKVIQNIKVRKHESIHAIHNFGYLHLIEKMIKKTAHQFKGFGKLLDPNDCSREQKEYVAEMGALYLTRQESPQIKLDYRSDVPPFYQKAKEDCEKLLRGEEVEIGKGIE